MINGYYNIAMYKLLIQYIYMYVLQQLRFCLYI